MITGPSTHLAAVWFADIVGYSQTASRDERAALDLVGILRTVLDHTLAEEGGRLVKTMGDGALAEFASADAAVRSALAVEHAFAERAGAVVPGARLRVGVHVGEVAAGLDGDVYGDGVNTAARLQQSAGPGEVVVSEDVWRSLRQRSDHRFTSLGQRRLKGLGATMRVYRAESIDAVSRRRGRTIGWLRRAICRRTVGYATAATLAGLAAYGLLAREGDSGRADPTTATATLAVLPFADLSPAEEDDYFSDGMTEELIAALGRLEGLRVAGRTSSFAFEGKNLPVDEIARQLGVAHVLEGGVRRSGDRLRVTARLVEGEDGFELWSEVYDRKAVDLFDVQEEIGRSVAAALDLRLPRGMDTFRIRERPPDLEAYDLYLQGRHAWRRRTREGLELAVEHFRQAIARDPNFAEAYVGLADAHLGLAGYRYGPKEETLNGAREALEHALALEPDLAEAFATRGILRGNYGLAWDSAEADFRRAIELNPGYASAHHWYGMMLVSVGRLDEALREFLLAIELDALAPSLHGAFAMALWLHGDLSRAEAMARRAHELAPEFFGPVAVLSRIYETQGRGQESLEAAQQAVALAPGNPAAEAYLGRALARFGDARKAREVVERLEAAPYPCAACIADVYVALGDADRAFRWLDARVWENLGGFYFPKVDPLYDPLRGDPRFVRFLETVGLS